MTNEITITLPRSSIHRVVAKGLLILSIALLFGFFYDLGVALENDEASALTFEEYSANFETYKEGLQQDDWGLAAHLALSVLVTGIFFGVYEAIAWGLATLFGHLRGVAPKRPD